MKRGLSFHLMNFHISPRLMTALCLIALLMVCPSIAGSEGSWPEFQHPAGFEISYPPDWEPMLFDDGQIEIWSGDDSAFVTIIPFNTTESAEDYTSGLAYKQGAEIIPGSLRKANAGLGQDEASALVTFSLDGVRWKAETLCSISNGHGLFFISTALEGQFDSMREIMSGIVGSVRLGQSLPLNSSSPEHGGDKDGSAVGVASVEPQADNREPTSQAPAPQASAPDAKRRSGAPADAGVSYVTWTDPAQKAFTIEVPRGWKVSGGTAGYPEGKISVGTYRFVIVLTSPDGKTIITNSDADIPVFQNPTELSSNMGMSEGTWITSNQLLMHYMTGADFACWYVTNILAPKYGYSDLSFGQMRDLPAAAKAINDKYVEYSLPISRSVGEVYFTCTHGGENLEGYYVGGTEFASFMNPDPNAGTWAVPSVGGICGYVAPQSRGELAGAVLKHMISSMKVDSNWLSGVIKTGEKIAAINRASTEEISNIITDSYWARQAVNAEIFRQSSNQIRDTTDVRDPQTGETWKVYSGYRYYWRNGNIIIGTQTYEPPDIGFTPVELY